MRSVVVNMVVLGALVVGCGSGGDERRPARAPVTSTTRTTSAALTVSSAQTPSSPSTNATMAPAATPPAPPVRRPVMVETASAVMRVTTSRCDREAACSNIGTGREFGDRDECVNEIGHYIIAALPSEECPSGVDADALSTCIRDVQAEPCANGGAAAVDRLSSCSRDRLCASPF